jgi:Putative Ig domain
MKLRLLPLLCVGFVSQCLATQVSITTKKMPNGTVETSYSAAISASGGCTPYKWAIVEGKIPTGLTHKLTDQTMEFELTGTPTKAASYSFTVSVTGCSGHVTRASYEIVIQAGAKHVVDLKWTASTSNDVAGYNVYRTTNSKTWKKLNAGVIAATDYDDSTVANGTKYYYAATTVSISGEESSKSPPIEVTVPE